MHGDMPQTKRNEVLKAFKDDEVKLLVCSDVAARGLDVQGVSHVFNYDVPFSADDYVHRIGRTGRAGMTGRAWMIATPDDEKYLQAIEKLIGKPIPTEQVETAPTNTPRRDNRPRSPDRHRSAPPQREASSPRADGVKRQPYRQEGESSSNNGFGDDVPDFLKR
jgi:superfamily II DNA/RNA helicase